jgi:ABC-type enterochelin transport system permease subunit
MRSAADHFSELKWYTIASGVLILICVLWASLEPNAVPQQRIIIAIVGAVGGAFILMFVTEYVRPHGNLSSSLPPIILQGQIKTIEEFQSFLGEKNEVSCKTFLILKTS